MEMKVVLVLLLVLCSGCAIGDGQFVMAGDRKGLQAFGEAMNGLVTNGKSSPDRKSAYWVQRENYEREETTRRTAPGFLGGLFTKRTQEGS